MSNSGPIAWEFPLFNDRGAYGPAPRVGLWDDAGNLIDSREMTKREQLEELFPATRHDWEKFREWLGRVNPESLRRLDLDCEQWKP